MRIEAHVGILERYGTEFNVRGGQPFVRGSEDRLYAYRGMAHLLFGVLESWSQLGFDRSPEEVYWLVSRFYDISAGGEYIMGR